MAVEFLGGPCIKYAFGRKDDADGARCPAHGRLPDANKGAEHLREVFGRMGFSDQEIVALSGAKGVRRDAHEVVCRRRRVVPTCPTQLRALGCHCALQRLEAQR